MQYLCRKQLTAGNVTYHPGEIIPDGVILPERSGKLAKNGYISEFSEETGKAPGGVSELRETEPGAYDGTVQIAVKCASDGENGQFMAIPASIGEIQQVFNIMQLNAEDGAMAIADVKSENVLILLHAADSRKMIKSAAKERADKLSSLGGS